MLRSLGEAVMREPPQCSSLQFIVSSTEYSSVQVRQLKRGRILVYKVSRTYLLDLLLRDMENETVRILHGANSLRAYEQLTRLQVEIKPNRISYKCPAGRHDDLAMSCAMVVWAAQHPHLPRWCWALEPRAPRSKGPPPSPLGWT